MSSTKLMFPDEIRPASVKSLWHSANQMNIINEMKCDMARWAHPLKEQMQRKKIAINNDLDPMHFDSNINMAHEERHHAL